MPKLTANGCLTQDGDTIPLIAKMAGHTDGGKLIYDTNKAAIGDNPMILPVGLALTIPPKPQAEKPSLVSRVNPFSTDPTKLNLYITLLNSAGEPLNKWITGLDYYRYDFDVKIGDKTYKADISWFADGFLVKDISPDARTGELTISYKLLGNVDGKEWIHKETISLHIGSLEPIVAPAGLTGYSPGKAIQKILHNQGCYPNYQDPDGDLTKPETRAALRTFQSVYKTAQSTLPHGFADKKTCDTLLAVQKNTFKAATAPEQTPGNWQQDKGVPISTKGSEGTVEQVNIKLAYIDPTDTNQAKSHRTKLTLPPVFPTHAYVAPCKPGDEKINPNVIRMKQHQYIFLDCGKWLGVGDKIERDFGLIWGKNAYLCEYKPTGNTTVNPVNVAPGGRLDKAFFDAMGDSVNVLNFGSAYWASDDDFDWDKLYIITADMHLMTHEVGTVWFGQPYELQAELDFLEFAQRLLAVAALKPHYKVIQVGDSYDLWVSYGLGKDKKDPVFVPNEKGEMELVKGDIDEAPAVDHLVAWIHDIQGYNWVHKTLRYIRKGGKRSGDPAEEFDQWLNPAEKAFRLLAKELKADDPAHKADSGMLFIYGNHDNYLIRPEVCTAAKIPQRRRYYEGKGIFVEHGHRLEACFSEDDVFRPGKYTFPTNFDGALDGFTATCGAFQQTGSYWSIIRKVGSVSKKVADWWAAHHDHRNYRREFAQIWLGRKANLVGSVPKHGYPDESAGQRKPPHIFAIGHTHERRLWYCNVNPLDIWRVKR